MKVNEVHPGYPLCVVPHPALRQHAHPIGARLAEDPARWQAIADGMRVTMRAFGGIGLAAPQVGMLSRLFVTVAGDRLARLPAVLVDPEVLDVDGLIESTEACLSLPGESYTVRRAREITVGYLDLDGEERTVTAREFAATVLQHELDHLDGILLDVRAREAAA